jgi:uncharacterized protein
MNHRKKNGASKRKMLEMTVFQLTVDPFTNMPILILKDASGAEALPIWIGLLEASAIATELEQIALDRPMTHDLMRNITDQSGFKVICVEINDVRDHTFYAALRLLGPRKKSIVVDSRPSDAIALALRTGAPIQVAKKVLERTQKIDFSEGRPQKRGRPRKDGKAAVLPLGGTTDGDAVRLRELLESLTDDHFGKWKM